MKDGGELAVGVAAFVGIGQGSQQANPDGGDELPRRRLMGFLPVTDERAQVDAIDPLEDQEEMALLLDKVVDVGDVGALQRRADARLFGEHIDVEL